MSKDEDIETYEDEQPKKKGKFLGDPAYDIQFD